MFVLHMKNVFLFSLLQQYKTAKITFHTYNYTYKYNEIIIFYFYVPYFQMLLLCLVITFISFENSS
jgi:hypothetical protein